MKKIAMAMFLLVFLFALSGCSVVLGVDKSAMIKAPSNTMSKEQVERIWEKSIELGRAYGYEVKQEDKARHYLLMEKVFFNKGFRQISVQIGNFNNFGVGVEVFGRVTHPDDDIVTSGVSADVNIIKSAVEKILNES